MILIVLFCSQHSFAAPELIVKNGSVSVGGFSSTDSDLSTVFAGVAGNASSCASNGSPCNTCVLSTALDACNQVSIYPSLKVTISFQVTKTVTGVAKLFIDNVGGTCCDTLASLPSATYTADSSVVTLETTWAAICGAISGMDGTCSGLTSTTASKILKFGVDSDGINDVEETERRSITVKFHYLKPGDVEKTWTYCPTTPAGPGICNLAFIPGDSKVYIDSALYGGQDSTSSSGGTSVQEAIAIFPVPVSTGGEAAAYASFQTNAASPIFKAIESDGTIPDSQVTGEISNYQKYCMVYGTRNKAQNIYKFVTISVNTATSCVTPSEVVGILEDKHCFISTAAFGSEMAPEVDMFRKFRNEFLLTNIPGKLFVKAYYKLSPPLAGFIAKNDVLRAFTRAALYPFLLFAYLSVTFGFGWALLTTLLAGTMAWLAIKKIRSRHAVVFLMLIFFSPLLKAEIIPGQETINHEGAKEGLIKITKDGTYIYDIKRPLKSESSRITFGQANNPEISLNIEGTDAQGVPNGSFNEFVFEDFYDDASGLIIGYDYEKFPWIDKGKLGYQIGFGAMFANGHGRLVASPNNPSAETYTFLTMPINVGGVYRFEWKDKQLLAPYVCGGGTYVMLLEKREDIATPHFAGGFGFYGAGGLLFNVAAIDDEAGYALESEYGVTALWLTLEFRVTEVNSESFGFSNQYVNAGLSFDF